MAGARETAQDEGAAFIVPSGYVFLRYQIHAIVKRSDQAEVGGTIVGPYFIMAVMSLQEYDGLPLSFLETAVDTVGFVFHLSHQVLISLNAGAARCANLNEGKFS